MKRIIIVFIICFFLEFPFVLAQAPFSRGVNLTGWFQAGSARQVHFTKFSKKDFINIKSLGCDVVRLPINLHYMTSGEPDFTLDTLFLNFLDEVVDWTEELEMHLILDNHTFDPSKDTEPEVENALLKIWPQMAEHFKNRSAYLYYEVLNEPHGISDGKWNAIQQNVIDAIRKIDKKHTIVIGPAGWNSYNNLDKMPEYEDDNLIYTFHFYDPFLFTHQGASWTTPSMVPLSGVPFPYEESKMPEFPGELKDTWIESNFNNYQNHGTVQEVKRLLDMAIKFKEERNVPLFCGEFGVYIPNSDPVERANWYEIVRKYLEENGISWTIWDYTGGFGIFEEGGNDMFEYDVDTSVVKGLGLNVPEQGEFNMQPDTTGFDVYKDYIQKNIVESSYSAEGTIDFYFDQLPNNGNYCIYWSGSERYGNTSFGFKPYKDLSILKENGYALDFFYVDWVLKEALM